MVSVRYYDLLKISPTADLSEVKAAYHRAAKSNHPDLFPEDDHGRREMLMMAINEAYLAIVCDRADSTRKGAGGPSPVVVPSVHPSPDAKAVGALRDPAYAYYKLGFRHFSEGRRTLAKHYLVGAQRIDFSTENINVLRLAVAALHHFHRAYSFFSRVASDFPTSVWTRDARVKIYYLNRYNAIYQRICDNLGRQIAQINAARARKDG